ncbi:hypothetical protein BGZ76_005145, partial [Entomortierella beljakovae]
MPEMLIEKVQIFCILDGQNSSTAFSIKIAPTDTVDDLKDAIKLKNPNDFRNIDANKLILWKVAISSHPPSNIIFRNLRIKERNPEKLEVPTRTILNVFGINLSGDTIHIIIQLPPVQQEPRSGTPQPANEALDILHADVKEATSRFFGPRYNIPEFLESFVKGNINLPLTTGKIPGMPRAWRRTFFSTEETRPSLLFLGLPDPSSQEAADSSRYNSANISDMIEENSIIPLFGVSGCGKTRAVMELLSQHWGFYFNASGDDWGSEDMSNLLEKVDDILVKTITPDVVDQKKNGESAKKMTCLLFLSRLLVFKYCLNVTGSSRTFTSARWTLLQTCPQVLSKDLLSNTFDVFGLVFSELYPLLKHSVDNLMYFVQKEFQEVSDLLIKFDGCPKHSESKRLLVVLDEAQIIGDAHNGSFKSTTTDDPRPLLSPILHGLRQIAKSGLTLITCGTGLSINTLIWVQSSGSAQKDTSSLFKFVEFPGWTDKSSIMSYIASLRDSLPDDESKQELDQLIPQEAVDMLFEKLTGRFRPIVAAVEIIIQRQLLLSPWKAAIEDTEEKLVSWSMRYMKGNLCNELTRLKSKQDRHRDIFSKPVEGILGLMLYRRCMFGDRELRLDHAVPELVE